MFMLLVSYHVYHTYQIYLSTRKVELFLSEKYKIGTSVDINILLSAWKRFDCN